MNYQFDWGVLWRYREALLNGLLLTIEISIIALLGATMIGILFGTASTSRKWWMRGASYAYVEVCRNIPLLVHILFWYVGLSVLRIPNFWCAVVGLSVYSSAYIAEIVRAGIQSVPLGQTETALASGLTLSQALVDVIYPQAIRIVLPSMAGMFSQLIKDSSLASVIAVTELTFQAAAIEGETFRSFEAYIGISGFYLIFVWIITQGLRRVFPTETIYRDEFSWS